MCFTQHSVKHRFLQHVPCTFRLYISVLSAMKSYKNILITHLFLLLTGCANNPYKGPPQNLSMGSGDGILIIGAPSDIQPTFISGTVKDGKFNRDTLTAVTLAGSSINGYLVGKFKASDYSSAFGLWSVFNRRVLLTVPCGNEISTFKVEAGKILYVADFYFSDQGNSASVSRRDNLDGAVNYLKSTYPSEKFEVLRASLTPLIFEGPCGPVTISIPISR